MRSLMPGSGWWIGALLVCLTAADGRAQTPVVKVVVRVRDTAGVVVAGAQVSIVQRLNEARASAVSDDHGMATLIVSGMAHNADAEVVVRKFGYERADRFFRAERDSMFFEVFVRLAAQRLAPMVVTAAEDIHRRSYHVSADDIANSGATLIDATDILVRLRPDMICGRTGEDLVHAGPSCRPMESALAKIRHPARACPSLALLEVRATCPKTESPPSVATNVWVNGQRIRFIALNDAALERQTGMLAGLLPGTMTVLSEIKPEHIAEMTYVDEYDTSIGKIGSNGGLFIVLKSGIVYEPGRGSHVATGKAGSPSNDEASPVLPLYRLRLLGVFDDATGEPIEGAKVIDEHTGTYATTTVTGTVSLFFLPEGGSPVRITKPGYEDLTIAVEISPEERQPLTLLMVRAAPKPPER